MDFDFVNVPSPIGSEVFEKLNAMIAAGDIPDILQTSTNTDLARDLYYDLAAEDQLLNISKMIEENPDRYPNIASRIKDPEADMFKAEDGNFYTVPRLQGYYDHIIIIRQDWLDELGLEMPTNTEELHDVLKEFVEEDPDDKGNFGLTVPAPWWFNHIFAGFTGGWEWVEKDGEYVSTYTEPGMKEAFKYLHSLYEEGLLDKEFFTHKPNKDELSKFINGRAGVLLTQSRNLPSIQKDIVKINPEAEVGLLPIDFSGPEAAARVSAGKFYEGVSIYKHAEDPARMLDFIEYLASNEASEMFTNGIEGEYSEETFEHEKWGVDPYPSVHRAIWGMVDMKYNDSEAYLKQYTDPEQMKTFFNQLDSADFAQNPVWGYGLESIQAHNADVLEVFNKYLVNFITGKADIDQEWDTYTKELEKAGLLKMQEEVQEEFTP
nr:extracellular solute-binding protein [Pseudalkalibacillus hwajinpoensis]